MIIGVSALLKFRKLLLCFNSFFAFLIKLSSKWKTVSQSGCKGKKIALLHFVCLKSAQLTSFTMNTHRRRIVFFFELGERSISYDISLKLFRTRCVSFPRVVPY